MQFDAHCIECLIHRHFELIKPKDDGIKADLYLRDIMRLILDAPKGVSAPYLTCQFAEAYAKYWPGEDPYARLKKDSNDLILELLPKIRPMVEQAEDPLALALKFARTGNFLDFGILNPQVAHKALREAIDRTPEMELDQEVYIKLIEDLDRAKHLLILGDNTGEIVFDILLVEHSKSIPGAMADGQHRLVAIYHATILQFQAGQAAIFRADLHHLAVKKDFAAQGDDLFPQILHHIQ